MKPLPIFVALLMCAAPLHASPTPQPKSGQTAQDQLPFGIPVPGKPNLVYSPYAKGKIVAVAGTTVMNGRTVTIHYKHGELVLCPYTGKKFRVP
jgi:hypothetical protein